MSSIYIQEPPTSGKVLLQTTAGDIEIELWTKETPKTCRNFIKHCMDGYYAGTIFHRIVKGFIIQGGDPTGTGEGGESIYGAPFKDEFHTRLRFCRRGLIAMANSGKDDNGSQFFITLAATPELQNKHTIFGKVAGDTIYNVLKLEEVEIEEQDRPMYPQKILKAKILLNPFDDLVAVKTVKDDTEQKKAKKLKAAGVKNFKLLSFGEEAEENEEEDSLLNKQLSIKSKSAHDVLQDSKLSAVTVEIDSIDDIRKEESDGELEENDNLEIEAEDEEVQVKQAEEMKRRIIDKLKDKKKGRTETDKRKTGKIKNHKQGRSTESSSEEDIHKGRDDKRHKKKDLKEAECSRPKKRKIDEVKEDLDDKKKQPKDNEMIKDYLEVQKQYKEVEKRLPGKGVSREKFTLDLLNKFKKKLQDAKSNVNSESDKMGDDDKDDGKDDGKDDDDDTWMTHSLQCDTSGAVLAKDASTKDDDWFEIYDPRNPINKRRRGEKSHKKSTGVKQ